jgi:hypothetical protein
MYGILYNGLEKKGIKIGKHAYSKGKERGVWSE